VETSYIFAGGQRIAKVTSSATQYFHQDHLGSATRVTDESGQLVEQAEFMPFGEMRAGSSSPPFASNYKYTDQELDVGTGLYNYDARMYDPIIGRFISPDSVVPDPANSQGLNRYSYTLNNPLRYVDPTGNSLSGPSSASVSSGVDSTFGGDRGLDSYEHYKALISGKDYDCSEIPQKDFVRVAYEYITFVLENQSELELTEKEKKILEKVPEEALEFILQARILVRTGKSPMMVSILTGKCETALAKEREKVVDALIAAFSYPNAIKALAGKIDIKEKVLKTIIETMKADKLNGLSIHVCVELIGHPFDRYYGTHTHNFNYPLRRYLYNI